MSEAQLQAFLQAVNTDPVLEGNVKAATDVEAVVEIATAAGFLISPEDLKQLPTNLSDDDLAGLSGGKWGGKDDLLQAKPAS